MVRVPGSLGDSGCHRESHEEAHADLRSGKPASFEIGSPMTPLNQDRSADRQSFGRSSTDGAEEGPATDLEEKSLPPPQVPLGTPADSDLRSDLQDERPSAKAIQTLVSMSSTKKSQQDQRCRAGGLDAFLIPNPVIQVIWSKIINYLTSPVQKLTARSIEMNEMKSLLHLMKECGIISEVSNSLTKTFGLLKPAIVHGGNHQIICRSLPKLTLENQTVRRHITNQCEEADTNNIGDPRLPRMTLGSFGAAMLSYASISPQPSAFLREQQVKIPPQDTKPTEDHDVDMESVESLDCHIGSQEYDRVDLDFDLPIRNAGASTSATSSKESKIAPRIPVSAMSELKGFAGRTEDRARAWLSKAKLKYLVFGDLRTGRTSIASSDTSRVPTWKDLFSEFPDAALWAFPSADSIIMHGNDLTSRNWNQGWTVRRDLVEHFVETLDGHDLPENLALPRITDADTVEEALRSRQRAEARQGNPCIVQSRCDRRRTTAILNQQLPKQFELLRCQEIAVSQRQNRVDRTAITKSDHAGLYTQQNERSNMLDKGAPSKRCSHCGSGKYAILVAGGN
ncbi:hypothetical protein PHPALM_30968 [Phytophthora palmivora]|uniref:Uncharacterized protein n=1 Tax=Phytophthora palmivora TaxID=4796 RepID=A0A2P4X3S6_9STRA|nr:hypothetical protein PHPALM_30968 [Phytophthora palmivora]